MKKTISILISIMILPVFSIIPAEAKTGDIIGEALNTDIVAYVNNYALQSYAVNGTSVIVAEDLRNVGFDVIWNDNDRSLKIFKSSMPKFTEMTFSKIGKTGSKFTDILVTDIKVYANDILIPSYAMNGYTMIPIESLSMFGNVSWNPTKRTISLTAFNQTQKTNNQILNVNTNNTNNNHDKYTSTIQSIIDFLIANGTYDSQKKVYKLSYYNSEYNSLSLVGYDFKNISFTYGDDLRTCVVLFENSAPICHILSDIKILNKNYESTAYNVSNNWLDISNTDNCDYLNKISWTIDAPNEYKNGIISMNNMGLSLTILDCCINLRNNGLKIDITDLGFLYQ